MVCVLRACVSEQTMASSRRERYRLRDISLKRDIVCSAAAHRLVSRALACVCEVSASSRWEAHRLVSWVLAVCEISLERELSSARRIVLCLGCSHASARCRHRQSERGGARGPRSARSRRIVLCLMRVCSMSASS